MPIETGVCAAGRLDGRDEGPGAGHQAALGGVDRVAIGDHEPGPRPNRAGRDRQPLPAQLRVQADDHGTRPAGGLEPVDPVPGDPVGGVPGHDHLEADLAQLPAQARAAQDQDALEARIDLAQVERRGPGRAHHSIGRDGRAQGLEPGDVVGPVPHRVVGHVDHDRRRPRLAG